MHRRGVMRRAAGAGGPPALPTTNLLAAWEAEDAIAIGGKVSSWPGSHGTSVSATQGTDASRPTLTTDGGSACVSFDGVNDSLVLSGMTAASGPITVYIVAKTPSAADASARTMIDIKTGRVFVGHYLGRYHMFDGLWRDSGLAITTARVRLTYQLSGGSFTMWRGATQGATIAVAEKALDGSARMGSRFDGYSLYLSGLIFAMYVTTAARNTAVEDYILSRWGV